MKRNLVLLKIGGSVITDKKIPYKAKRKTIERLAKEIKEARKKRKFSLIIGHGSGSFGHTSAKIYKTFEGCKTKKDFFGLCVVQNDAAKLNRILVDIFLKEGLRVFSVQPSAILIMKRDKLFNLYPKVIEKLLEKEIIPVVYGDAVLDLEKGCTIVSTERVLSFLAKKLGAKRIIFGTKEEGVYIKEGRSKKIISEINRNNWQEIKKHIFSSEGIDVTGGMFHKVEEAVQLSKLGFEVEIISESAPGSLKKSLLGKKVGTIIKW